MERNKDNRPYVSYEEGLSEQEIYDLSQQFFVDVLNEIVDLDEDNEIGIHFFQDNAYYVYVNGLRQGIIRLNKVKRTITYYG